MEFKWTGLLTYQGVHLEHFCDIIGQFANLGTLQLSEMVSF